MSHSHLRSEAAAPRPSDEHLAGELRFQVVGRLATEEAEAPARRCARRIPWASMVLLAIIVLGCALANVIAARDPSYMDLLNCNRAPCREFLFGTDNMGRDVFSMIWHGGRVSLTIGVLATALSTAIAVIYGALSGLAPDWLDALMMRLTEILLSVPSLLMVVFVQAALGSASVLSISVVLGVTGWMSIAKIVRTEVRQLHNSEYVVASRCMGGGFFHVLLNHLAPSFVPSVLFMVVMNVRGAIVSESTLSFMGIGLPLEIISWGSMLSLAEKALLTGSWWIILIPGGFLVATLMCVTNIGNALRRGINRRESNL